MANPSRPPGRVVLVLLQLSCIHLMPPSSHRMSAPGHAVASVGRVDKDNVDSTVSGQMDCQHACSVHVSEREHRSMTRRCTAQPVNSVAAALASRQCQCCRQAMHTHESFTWLTWHWWSLSTPFTSPSVTSVSVSSPLSNTASCGSVAHSGLSGRAKN